MLKKYSQVSQARVRTTLPANGLDLIGFSGRFLQVQQTRSTPTLSLLVSSQSRWTARRCLHGCPSPSNNLRCKSYGPSSTGTTSHIREAASKFSVSDSEGLVFEASCGRSEGTSDLHRGGMPCSVSHRDLAPRGHCCLRARAGSLGFQSCRWGRLNSWLFRSFFPVCKVALDLTQVMGFRDPQIGVLTTSTIDASIVIPCSMALSFPVIGFPVGQTCE